MVQDNVQLLTKRRQANAAIQLAMANRWEEAAAANRAILQVFPDDGDSQNRLGKALMEMERYADARKAYKKALALDPGNKIAKKNLERLNVLVKSKAAQAETSQADPKLFIEEMGKSAITVLEQTSKDKLATLNAGDRLELRAQKSSLTVETPGGEAIGVLEPMMTSRLLKLIEGGNEYAAGVTSLANDECRVIIKETYQHPDLAGKPSFPNAVTTKSTRPYTKGSLLRRSARGDEDGEPLEAEGGEDEDGKGDSSDEHVAQEGHVRLNDAAAAEDEDDDEFD